MRRRIQQGIIRVVENCGTRRANEILRLSLCFVHASERIGQRSKQPSPSSALALFPRLEMDEEEEEEEEREEEVSERGREGGCHIWLRWPRHKEINDRKTSCLFPAKQGCPMFRGARAVKRVDREGGICNRPFSPPS